MQKPEQGGEGDEADSELRDLPTEIEPGDQAVLPRHDLQRLRREIAAPEIVWDAGSQADYAYADFFKAKISNPNTRKAHRLAANRFPGWSQLRG